MGIFSALLGGHPKTTVAVAAGMTFQTSAQGLPIPLVFGTTKIAPNLIWYGDFKSVAQASGGKGGVGGGGGGKNGGGTAGYTYSAAFQLALCDGPIIGVGDVYANKQVTTLAKLNFTLFLGDYSQATWGYLTTNHPTQALNYRGLAHIDSPKYSMGSSPQIPNHNVEAMARYSGATAQQVYSEKWVIPAKSPFTATVKFSAQWTADVQVIDSAGTVYTKVGSAPASHQYTAAAGVYTFNTANKKTTIYITYNASAGPDADPSAVVSFLLTDSKSGAGFPSSKLASLATYQSYCIATGLLISPSYITQTPCSSMIADLMTATNSAPVFSSGMLSIVPYGDTSITANGATYTAPSSPQYDLTDDDFAPQPGEDPVYLDRLPCADAYNSIQLECLDRANQYNPAVVGAKDQALIDTYGLRETVVPSHWFANLAAGRISVQLQLQYQSRRNKYRFRLDHRYVRLDPMDIVTLTCKREDGTTWLNKEWVRIETIDEEDDGTFSMLAYQYDAGSSHSPLHSFQNGVGFNADYNSDPGDANAPVIFEPPVQISQTGGLEINLAASGGTNWGGCQVYISSDDSTYTYADTITGQSRQGVLSSTLATGVDPDVTHTLHVDLTMSAGSLTSGTQDDADGNHTLCYVDGEYISYETATLTGTSLYDLTYLRRGQFGSTISAHLSGTKFARMDSQILAVAFDKSKVNTTLYIKLVSFNIYGGGLQDISTLASYSYNLTGPAALAQVQGFQAQQQGNVVAAKWIDLAYEGGLKGYDLAYGPVGALWDDMLQLTEAHRGTEMTNASIPPGTWDIVIRGHDIADNFGPESRKTIIVENQNTIISDQSGATDGWPGTLTNFVQHYTGCITPKGTKTVDQYTAISAPTAPTLGTVAGGTIALTTYYAKITYVDSGGESLPSSESSQAVLLNNLLTVASPSASGLASGYNVYVSTSAGTETLQNSTPIAIGTNWTEPTTGLVSGAALPSANTTGWQVFNVFVPDPVSTANYITSTADTGYNAELRVYSMTSNGFAFGTAGPASIDFQIDTWLNGAADPGVFTSWTIGYVTLEYLISKIIYTGITETSVCYISDFQAIIDNPPDVEGAVAVIAPGGTTVTFPAQFHSAPFVTGNVVGATGLYMEPSSVTEANCVINVYDHTGASVGGTVNYTATGA